MIKTLPNCHEEHTTHDSNSLWIEDVASHRKEDDEGDFVQTLD
jgi:hypothetical protein